ncbi:MAG TPA: hypothetical protein VHA77_10690 [Xanthobacteraceae bacterium]|nr:hypothetical protein [Xanthobacteraceae bacterium]
MAFPISPLVIWTIGVAGAAALAKLFTDEWRRVNADLRQCRASHVAEPVDRQRLPRLRPDPVTGIYRPE